MKVQIREAALRLKGWIPEDLVFYLKDYVSPTTVYNWITGRRQPSYENLDMLCTLLDCSLDELLVYEEFDFADKSKKKRKNSRKAKAERFRLTELDEARARVQLPLFFQ